jgi:lipopolysaccharide transport system permease protein
MNNIVAMYDSAKRAPPMVEEFVEAVRYRELIKQLIRRDIVTRYKRSVLGVAWTMLNPLGMMLVLLLAFSAVFGSTRSYAVYLLTGLIAWNFFAQTTIASMNQITWGSTLLHRVYLPRVAFAISATGTGLVNLLLSFIPLGVVMLVARTPLHGTILLLPIAVAFLTLFALGTGLLISTLAVYFPDVAEMYQIALVAWMYLTPIIYPESIVPEQYRWWMFNVNPMYHVIKLFRMALVSGSWPSAGHLASTAVIALGMFAVGWIIFTGKADEFAYRV